VPASIRKKLLLALLSTLALIGLASSAATWLAVHKEAEELFDYQLQQMALSLRDQVPQGEIALLGGFDYDFIVQVWSPGGALVYLSNRGIVLPQSGTGYQTVSVQGEAWRVFTLQQEDRSIQVAAPESLRRDRSSAMALRILVPLAASFPLFAILIWLLVSRELRPLEQIAGAIRRRRPDSLEPLAAGDLPEEVVPLVSELNSLLARLGGAIETQRRFTEDAAHELRSPLTALQLQIQLVERARSPEELREALDSLRAGAKRAAHLVEQLLTMARLEPEAAREAPSEVALQAVGASVLEDLEPLAEAKGVELRSGRVEAASVAGQPEALRTLARNLVDNAIRYTPAGGRIELSVFVDSGRPTLEVKDSGPGIPPEERERVFDRFYRLPGAGTQGSGLGLAIVRQIAEAHRAEVSLGEADHGKGLRVTVRFPAITK
jgi:signal transduction histidine kinase